MDKLSEQQQLAVPSAADDEIEIDLREIFFFLLGNWRMVLLTMRAGAVLCGFFHAFLLKPSYRADAEIYITNTDSVISFSDLQLSAALTDDYANIIKSRTVLKRVIQQLDLDLNYDQLRGLVEVNNPGSTHIIEILVTCDDIELSRNIANALLNVSIDQIYQIIGSNEPTIIDYSEAEAVENVTPSLFSYLAKGAVAGMFLACAFLLIRVLMDTTVKTEDDIDRYLHIPALASVPYFRESQE